jgi:hypothetical protein
MIVRDGLGSNSGYISTGITTTGGLLAALIPAVAAVPLIGPIIGGVALLVSALGIGNGCGGTCTEATQVVNQAEPILKQNLEAAQQTLANNGCLTSSEQATLVANFNSVWNQVKQQCGQIPAPGGTQCISDRSPGGRYDWTSYYLTPIMNMPVCDASSVGASLGSMNPLLLIGGGILVLGLMMGGDGK